MSEYCDSKVCDLKHFAREYNDVREEQAESHTGGDG